MNLMHFFKGATFVVLALYAGTFFVVPKEELEYNKLYAAEYAKQLKSNNAVRQKNCIKEALWFEARGESEDGMRAVASVIYNRVRSSKYPGNYCAVIQQPKQFSYRNELGNSNKLITPKPAPSEWSAYRKVEQIASEIHGGYFKPVFGRDVLWYHHTRVNPEWSKRMRCVTVQGSHLFLRS